MPATPKLDGGASFSVTIVMFFGIRVGAVS